MKSAILISTGTELLTGRVTDTNCAYMSAKLFPTAVAVKGHVSVGDDLDELERALRDALDRADLVIVTGGLGPTDDDVTIESLRRIFGFEVEREPEAEMKMNAFFAGLGMAPSAGDVKMIEVPRGARVLPNRKGLAPGFLLERGSQRVAALPGVPREMMDMFDNDLMPLLAGWADGPPRRSLAFRVVGMRESDINRQVNSMGFVPDSADWGITAASGVTTVTFIQKDPSLAFDGDLIEERMRALFGARMLAPGRTSPEEEVLALLEEKGLTLGAAESCTGGLLSRRLTDVPGASRAFRGAVVAYDNGVKRELLGVEATVLEIRGAVSEETAMQMACGARKALSADIAVSVTGIAGPDGGTPDKPVGTVCFALAWQGGETARTRHFRGDRERIRSFSALFAVEMVRAYLRGIPFDM